MNYLLEAASIYDDIRRMIYENSLISRHAELEKKYNLGNITLKEMMEAEKIVDGVAKERGWYFHGSTSILEIGDEILPPDQTDKLQEIGRKKNLDKVFFTDSRGSAKIYAGRAVNVFGGSPIVYYVKPMSRIEVINNRPGTEVYASSHAKAQKSDPFTPPLSKRFD
jgi:hypothetical protein